MTILAGNNYCATCEAFERDHSTICTVCGSLLQEAPVRELQEPLNPLHAEIRDSNRELRLTLESLRTRIGESGAAEREIMDQLQVTRQEIQAIMDPAQHIPPMRPTQASFLSKLTRITMKEDSSMFHQAQLVINDKIIEGSLGELGSVKGNLSLEGAVIVVAKPKTGDGGLENENFPGKAQPFVMYFDRGGVTFAQKALMAQAAGAKAVVIGNSQTEPWPYLMQDSKGEAKDLSIPTIMVKLSDRSMVSSAKTVSMSITQQTKECIVCTESFSEGQTLLQLSCHHVYHEACLAPWLMHHNTCPYCRLELPTDDADYDAERRRERRTHAGSAGQANDNGQDFYA